MTREEMLLLTELKRVCDQAPQFSQGFPDNGLPVDAETLYAQQIIELGRGILRHARVREPVVVEGPPSMLKASAPSKDGSLK